MKCFKCGDVDMELVDSHYSLELEFVYGHPVEVKTFICPKCDKEVVQENYHI